MVMVFLLALGTTQAGCMSVRYLAQAGVGQLDLMSRAQPIDELIESDDTPPRLRAFLAEVEPVRAFVKANGMTPDQSYQTYAELPRSAAVWVVSAAPTLSLESKTWSFPGFGSFPYLGWFDIDDAREFARAEREKGHDVYLRGASAYSTLGWFEDPLLSTMIARHAGREGILVNTIIHESLHATLYVSGQSTFNEGLASFVADLLTPRYLVSRFGIQSVEFAAYRQAQRQWRYRTQVMAMAHGRLKTLYASSLTRHAKLAVKEDIFEDLRRQLRSRYPLNNAALAEFRTYEGAMADFGRALDSCEGDLSRFLTKMKTITPKDFPHEQAQDLSKVLPNFHCDSHFAGYGRDSGAANSP